MTRTLTAHFDGKVIVPDSPVDLPQHQRFCVTVTSLPVNDQLGTAEFVLRQLADHPISDEDAQAMRVAIEDAFERIEPASNINFDSSDR
jgi:hypothetical protein